MISITKDELDQYKVLGHGKYGKVYQVDDSIAYKIYYETLPDIDGFAAINPALLTSKKTINKLLKRGQNIQYTDLIQDYIVINNRFGGVCIPFYDGKTLSQLKDTPYQVKRDISTQMVRNHKELLRHFIYPRDYHTDNIMVTKSGEVKLIDLDDFLTKVSSYPNPFLALLCTGRLNETIREFFHEPRFSRGKELEEMITRPRAKYSPSTRWLDHYLTRLEATQDYLIIDNNSDLNIVSQLTNNHKYRILMMFGKEILDYPHVVYTLYNLKEKGIPIYDIVANNQIEEYFTNNPSKRKVLIHDNTPQVL